MLTAQSSNAAFSGAGSSIAFSGAGSSASGLSAAGSSAAGSAARSQHSYATSMSIALAAESVQSMKSTQSYRTPKVRKKREDPGAGKSKSFGTFGAGYGEKMIKESQAKAMKDLGKIEGGGKGEMSPGKRGNKMFLSNLMQKFHEEIAMGLVLHDKAYPAPSSQQARALIVIENARNSTYKLHVRLVPQLEAKLNKR